MKYIFILIISILGLWACQPTTYLANIEENSPQVDTTMAVDTSIENLIAPYKKQLEATMNIKIGETAQTLPSDRPESLLGNFIADALHVQSEAYFGKSIDLTYTNKSGLRIPALNKGDITNGNIFELMPFDNMMVVLLLDYETLMQLIEHFVKKGGEPVSHHFRMVIKDGKPTNITLNGKPLDKNKTYKVATTDYLANGGDRLDFLKDKKRANLQVTYRDAVIEYIKAETAKGNIIDAKLDGRVVKEE